MSSDIRRHPERPRFHERAEGSRVVERTPSSAAFDPDFVGCTPGSLQDRGRVAPQRRAKRALHRPVIPTGARANATAEWRNLLFLGADPACILAGTITIAAAPRFAPFEAWAPRTMLSKACRLSSHADSEAAVATRLTVPIHRNPDGWGSLTRGNANVGPPTSGWASP